MKNKISKIGKSENEKIVNIPQTENQQYCTL